MFSLIDVGLRLTAVLPDGEQFGCLRWSTLAQKIRINSRFDIQTYIISIREHQLRQSVSHSGGSHSKSLR